MPRPADDLDQIGFLLGRAYYSYIGLLERWLDEAGLSEHCKPGMGSLLFALFREEDRTITEVARELQLAKSTMTTMVARMKRAGLITVRPDPADARASRLRLTPLARSLEKRCRGVAGRMERFLCHNMSEPEQEHFRTVLTRVTRALAESLQANGAGKHSSKSRRSSLQEALR